jgi:hypothetical protein
MPDSGVPRHPYCRREWSRREHQRRDPEVEGRKANGTLETPAVNRGWDQLAPRESQAGPFGAAVRLVVPMKPGNAGGGKGPWLEANARSDKEGGTGDEPSNPGKCSELQAALRDKAKKSPGFRFYALYDKMYRKDVLTFAYACCKANGGAAGVDQTFADMEAHGAKRWLDELTQELKSRTCRPLPERRVYIPKPGDSNTRWECPLGEAGLVLSGFEFNSA